MVDNVDTPLDDLVSQLANRKKFIISDGGTHRLSMWMISFNGVNSWESLSVSYAGKPDFWPIRESWATLREAVAFATRYTLSYEDKELFWAYKNRDLMAKMAKTKWIIRDVP